MKESYHTLTTYPILTKGMVLTSTFDSKINMMVKYSVHGILRAIFFIVICFLRVMKSQALNTKDKFYSIRILRVELRTSAQILLIFRKKRGKKLWQALML